MTDHNRLRELAQKATPGPWFRQSTLVHGPDQGGIDIGPLLMDVYDDRDAAFIVEARNTVIALLDENDRLRKALRRFTDATQAYHVAIGRAPNNYREEEAVAAFNEHEVAWKVARAALEGTPE